MMGSGMREARENLVTYSDLLIEDFQKLYSFVLSGGPGTRVNIGKRSEIMRNLINTYILADRFQMLAVREWIHDSILDNMQSASRWKAIYKVQIKQDPPIAGAEAYHREQIEDWAEFHFIQKSLPRELRPIALNTFIDHFIDNCPGEALDDAWEDLDEDFRMDLGRGMVRKMMISSD